MRFPLPRLLLLALWTLVAVARAEEPEYALKQDDPAKLVWRTWLPANLPPLTHARGTRWPLVLWEGVEFAPLTPPEYPALLARGVAQHLRLEEASIPAAQAMQAAGMPVILLQGEGGTWPARLAGDASAWAHIFDYGYYPRFEVRACPAVTTGYALAGEQVRTRLRQLRAAGVTVNAVWMDWEGDPLMGAERLQQARHCQRCRQTLPPGVLANGRAFSAYMWRRYLELTGTYLAAPVQEVFPACSVTNWNVVLSTPEQPVLNWVDRPFAAAIPPNFTASNPIAYGVTSYFRHAWPAGQDAERDTVDQLYTHLLLREVSADTANRRVYAPDRGSFPWVCRWLPDPGDLELPVMSRARYRETLRHLWLRGIDGMQVFNAQIYPGYAPMAAAEVADAQAVYDECLAYQDLLRGGEPLNLAIPPPQGSAAFWSGVRRGEQAVIRTFKPCAGTELVHVQPWPHLPVDLPATTTGTTYLLTRRAPGIVEIATVPAADSLAPE